MDINKSIMFTKNIFRFDLMLNWTIGLGLTLFSSFIDRLLFHEQFIEKKLYFILGILFLGFALWQTVVYFLKQICRPFNLAFAAILAVIPSIALTGALIVFGTQMRILPKVLLWTGDLYMLLLTAWYLYGIFLVSHQKKAA